MSGTLVLADSSCRGGFWALAVVGRVSRLLLIPVVPVNMTGEETANIPTRFGGLSSDFSVSCFLSPSDSPPPNPAMLLGTLDFSFGRIRHGWCHLIKGRFIRC